MAAPNYTYTITNGQAADASQVQQSFNDILNGVTDGTKDLSINALTCAGATSLNGNVALGNAAGDDVTHAGSLASSIPIKTQFTYDIGSAVSGLRSIYFGSSDAAARGVRIIGGTVAADYTLTLPTTVGASLFAPVGDGSGVLSWEPLISPWDVKNFSLAASAGSSALTLSLKAHSGSDASSTNPIAITFRSATSATGTAVRRTVTGAISTVISNGSSGGKASGFSDTVHVYAIDNAGTVELAWSGTRIFSENEIHTTTAEGGAGAADLDYILYSTTARTGVAIRYLGSVDATQTLGVWASVERVSAMLTSQNTPVRGKLVLHTYNGYGSTNTCVPRFTTTTLAERVGTGADDDFSYNTGSDEATYGAYITINKGMIISSTVFFDSAVNAACGVGLTSGKTTEGTTSIYDTTPGTVRIAFNGIQATAGVTSNPCCTVTFYAPKGTVIKPHTNAGTPATTTRTGWMVQRIA